MRPIALILALIVLSYPTWAQAKGKPSLSSPVHLCESVDVYTGAVDVSHPSTRIAEVCRNVTIAVAQKAIDRCTAKGDAAVCEVLYSADKKTLFIESKILVSKGAK